MAVQSKDYNSDLLRGNTDSILLFLINENETENNYGSQLIKKIENRSHGFFRFKEGTIYPALHKMENEGFIKGKWEKLPNGQMRRCYQITEKGIKILSRKISMWHDFSGAMNLIFHPADG